VWVVDGRTVGVGIRESNGALTDYWCRFAPHLVDLNDSSGMGFGTTDPGTANFG